jgi:hypothetical protein
VRGPSVSGPVTIPEFTCLFGLKLCKRRSTFISELQRLAYPSIKAHTKYYIRNSPRLNISDVAYKYIPKEQRDKGKFTERSKPCMMLGYVHDTAKIWRIWDFEIKKAIECSNVIFNEDLKAYEAIQQERIDPDQIVFPQTDELEIIEIPEISGYERKLPRP